MEVGFVYFYCILLATIYLQNRLLALKVHTYAFKFFSEFF